MNLFADDLHFLEQIVHLSVDLHNLNVRTQKSHELSLVQWLVLRNIIKQPAISAGCLAEVVKLHPSSLSPTLVRLEAAGYIHCLERPSDSRRKMLVASPLGYEICLRFEGRQRRIVAEAKSICGQDTLDRMTRAARYIVDCDTKAAH